MRELALAKEPIVDNLPGTNFVSIDLPRPSPRPAFLLPFLDQTDRPNEKPGLWCPIGITPDGSAEWLDLTALPHMLVAGATGMGKTMFLYSLIMSLVHYYGPNDLELVLVDPKQTDFVFFNQLPHLRQGRVITEPREAIDVLIHLLTDELTARTETLAQAMARDIRSYNARFPDKPIHPIVVVIDEFADLADIMTRPERDNFDHALRRLAQRARNVGIHLVLATQRPTTDIVNGTLKTNLPCRISFRLASQVDSRTILDQSGAEHLLGNGDMLVSWNGRTQRLQGFYIPENQLISALGLGG
jgi:DNA segregation ATPase FtsK/SpoIIIE-like protein